MKLRILILVAALAGVHSRAADASRIEAPVVIGQPSIFWHNGQWQTWKDGVWTPYGQEPAEPGEGESQVARGNTPNNNGTARLEIEGGKIHRLHDRADLGKRRRGTDIGRATGALGQPNIAIGRTTIGIGQPTIGIGQPTIGIGQPTIGIGQPTIGIGQPNAGVGQRNGIGQTTVGIGKQTPVIGRQGSQRKNRD